MIKGFQEGEWEFFFPNEDKYVGHYCAHVSGLAWRQGKGIYYTQDDQIYEGLWKDDKLDEAENLEITYKNGDKYTGRISKFKYNGPGTYFFSNGTPLTCNFENNKPSGDIIYIDHHERLWYGRAEEEHAMLAREHVFSYELDFERGKGRPKYPPLQIREEEVEPEETIEEFDMKEWEKQIFAKSTKAPSAIDLEDSDWFREHQEFEEMFETIMSTIANTGTNALNEEERIWYKNYLKSMKILEQKGHKKLKKLRADLLKEFFKEESMDTCPPTRVFYPTQFEEEVEQ